MKAPLKSWLKRLGKPKGKAGGSPSPDQRNGVEYLHAGQVLSAEEGNANPAALILKGRCETPTPLFAGDSIDATEDDAPRTTIRALADSAILRMSRDALRRLTSRWPSSKNPPSIRMVPPDTHGGRVICLLPLSEGIPCTEFAESMAATISSETARHVLRVKIGAEDTRAETVARKLDRARDQFPYVLVEVAREAGAEAIREAFERSWAIYPILRQDGESIFELNLLVREAVDRGLGAVPIKPLVYLEASENAHGLSRYIEGTTHHPVHLYLRDVAGDATRLQANLRRLGREMCDRQVGLVLSSGAARGLAHIGVIQVLEENGIEVDMIAGSSMGAYVAAVWGVGYGGREMEQFARELEGYRGFWRLLDLAIYPRKGFLMTNRVRKRLERTIGNVHFSDMVRPIRVVATRLDTLERIVFSGGNVVDAVLASISIPGICVPVTLDGVRYIDGGICDPLPVEALTSMGIHKIIAVNTIATPETIRTFQAEAAETRRARRGARLNGLVNPFAAGNVFDTMMRSIHAGQTRLAEISCRDAAIVLRPYWCKSRWHDFGNPSRYIPLGRQAAEAQLPAIRALIDAPTHENQSAPQVLAQVA